jgi:C4-type Zn-finger protein
MSDGSTSGTNHHLYCVTVGCPACHSASQFVVTTEDEVGLMQDIPVLAGHCPDCGIQVDVVGGWDRHAEHEVMAVSGDRAATTKVDRSTESSNDE